MYDVMIQRGTDSHAMDVFKWLQKQKLLFDRDWTWKTVPGSSMMQVSFYKQEHANWFKLRWQ